jgi:fucose permease
MGMLFLGVGNAIIGAASKNIGLTPFQIGVLITMQNIGFTISVVASGVLADTVRKPKILFVGSLVLSLCFLLFFWKSGLWINVFIMLGIGIGIGAYEGVTDALLMDIHERRQSLYITINHFFVTAGGLVITVYLIFLQMNWRMATTQASVAVFLLAVLFFFLRPTEGRAESESLRARLHFLRKQPLVLALVVLAICIIGLELGTTGILTSYLMDVKGFTQVTSKVGLLTFLGGLACGRLVLGFFTRQDRIIHYILILFAAAVIVSFLLYIVPFRNAITYLLLFLFGGIISIVLPLIITLGGLFYPDMAGTVMGIIKLGIPIGGIITPALLSVLVKATTFTLSLLLFPAIAVIGVFVSLALFALDVRNKSC